MMYAPVYMHVYDKVYLWRSEDNLGSSSLHPSFLLKQGLFVFAVVVHTLGLLVVKFLGGFSCLYLPFHGSKSETTDMYDYAKLEIWT